MEVLTVILIICTIIWQGCITSAMGAIKIALHTLTGILKITTSALSKT